MRKVAALRFAAVLIAAACGGDPSAPLPALDPPPLSLLDGPTLSGAPLDRAALDGKVVVVNFWSPG